MASQSLVATRDVYYWSVGGILRIEAGATVYVVRFDERRQVVELRLDSGLTYTMRLSAAQRCFVAKKEASIK